MPKSAKNISLGGIYNFKSYKSNISIAVKNQNYLLRTNIYGFSQDNPDDTLKKRWNSQRAKVSPVVQGLGKQAAGIEVCEECSFTLEKIKRKNGAILFKSKRPR